MINFKKGLATLAVALAVSAPVLGFASATSARASPCSEEIARLEKAISENSPAAAPTAPQSVGAQLGHQPTPESIRRAEAAAGTGVDAILNRAKALDAEGKTKECMDLVATAKLRLQ
jgi:hypothetical protein